ncbi:MAG TPA: TetR family transcriptional regulator [Nocardioidaceae bacterium]|nr:TetR family transcriptional regulator [Nocardioidaceae bacterium]
MSRTGGVTDDAPRWHGSTADERQTQRRRQLLDAGFQLLGTEGAAAVSVRAVTRVSGLSPRYFYESFSDRDELLIAVWEEQYDEVRAVVDAAITVAPDDFLARMRAALLVTLGWLREVPERGRAMLAETLAEELLRRHARRRLPELVLDTAVQSGGTLWAGDTPAKVEVAVVALSGAIVNLFLEWSGGALDVTDEELVDSIVELAAAALATALR